MGGKNAIIVDTDADLDVAVSEVVVSAFHYGGQKCSAASRVIVLEAAYDEFVRRLVEATRSLRIGPPEDPALRRRASHHRRLPRPRSRATSSKGEARVDAGLRRASRPGRLADGGFNLAGPHVFATCRPDAVIAQEEIFGPVRRRPEGRRPGGGSAVANGCAVCAEPAVFSLQPGHDPPRPPGVSRRQPLHQPRDHRRPRRSSAVRRLQADRHIGSKAGGPDYLLQFVELRVITENTMRRGFAPPEDLLDDQPT